MELGVTEDERNQIEPGFPGEISSGIVKVYAPFSLAIWSVAPMP